MKKTISLVLVLALGLTTEVANADFTFGTPTNLGPTINSHHSDHSASISSDGLALYFQSHQPGVLRRCDIMVARRESPVEREQLRVLFIGNSGTSWIRNTLDSLIQASPYSESTFEYVAPDSWTLQQHLDSNNTMSRIKSQDWDFVVLQEQVLRASRPYESEQFYDAVANLSEPIKESGAQVVLYMIWGFRDGDPLNPQINPDYETMQQRLVEAYTEAARQVDAIIAPVGLAWQRVRRNKPDLGRQLYHSDGKHPSNKGAFLTACVFYATLFDADPTELAFNGGLSAEEAAYLKLKAKEAFNPVVDFNGDEIVDIDDLLMLIEHWGTDEPLCDIGPMLWGDGIVDVQDLDVLMSYWGQEILPPELIAYWRLDEAEGDIASDSSNGNDGTVYGDPAWQPEVGIVDGALQLDGIDDYVSTPFVLNPADDKFSVFAWIKGGAPGQVIISQTDGIGGTGATWLGADSSGGNLMTGLVTPPGGRSVPQPLVSEIVVIDNQWHLIGFVWDGSIRALYVDGVEVAKDTQAKLEGSDGGLHISAGKNLEVGTFFSGLIDDVRIYSLAVTP